MEGASPGRVLSQFSFYSLRLSRVGFHTASCLPLHAAALRQAAAHRARFHRLPRAPPPLPSSGFTLPTQSSWRPSKRLVQMPGHFLRRCPPSWRTRVSPASHPCLTAALASPPTRQVGKKVFDFAALATSLPKSARADVAALRATYAAVKQGCVLNGGTGRDGERRGRRSRRSAAARALFWSSHIPLSLLRPFSSVSTRRRRRSPPWTGSTTARPSRRPALSTPCRRRCGSSGMFATVCSEACEALLAMPAVTLSRCNASCLALPLPRRTVRGHQV